MIMYLFTLVIPFLLIVAVVIFIIVMAKKGAFRSKTTPQITMRNGEVSILATHVVWMQKKVYLNKYRIPHGVLDITNQRVVYTRTSGDKVDFALEKADIEAAIHTAGIRVKIQAKDGMVYALNTMPVKDTLDALEQMGVPVQR